MGVMYEVNRSTGAIGDPVLDSSTGSGGGGGLTQEEHEALMSISSMPARGDFNPLKETDSDLAMRSYTNNYAIAAPILIGYDKVAFYFSAGGNGNVQILDAAGNVLSTIAFTINTWSSYYDIPEGGVYLKFVSPTSQNSIACWVSLLTKDSPYNPDNQNP